MIRIIQGFIALIARLVLFSLVIVGLVAVGGFAGVGPLSEELDESSPIDNLSGPLDGPSDVDLDELATEQNSTAADEQLVEQFIHEEINEEREAAGLDPLTADEGLTLVARNHSNDMATREYVGHENPDGETPADRLSTVGCSYGGENVAQSWIGQPVQLNGETTTVTDEAELADHLVEGWMNSPGHRENILRDSYGASGVGVVIDADNRVYATQKFCSGPTPVGE